MRLKVPIFKNKQIITFMYISLEDKDLLSYKWHLDKNGYVRTKINNKNKYVHRIILERIINKPLSSTILTDHIDCKILNNVRSNLRPCTKRQNNVNKKFYKKSKTGYRGVTLSINEKRKKRYKAQIKFNNKNIFLGYFFTAIEAAQAYDNAAKIYNGEFAVLNFN